MTKTTCRKNLLGVIAVALPLFGASTASAQTLGEPVAGVNALGEPSVMRLSLTLAPMPMGTIKSGANGKENSTDLGFAFAIAPAFDYSINQFLFVGLAPQFILNVKPKDEMPNVKNDAWKQLDLRVRVGGNAKIADTAMLYGYLAPGYSMLMLPDSAKTAGVDDPAGFILGFAAGAMYDLTPDVFLNGELGYQVGYQKVSGTFMGVKVEGDSKTNFLHVGVGLGLRL